MRDHSTSINIRKNDRLRLCLYIFLFFVVLFQTNMMLYHGSVSPSGIVLVPGDGGSQAFARLRSDPSNSFLIWVNLRYFVTPGTLFKYFGLVFDPTTNRTSDGTLATIEFPGWGDTLTIENLDTYEHSKTEYFSSLVNSLIRLNSFYIRNQTVRGCPYDFRKAPNENEEFNRNLKELIEETFIITGDRVVLLGHSMGVMYTIHFLHSMTDEWKKNYIRGYIATSGPLGGAVKALKIECSGDNLGVFVESPLSYRTVQRSMPSTAFLMPDRRLWNEMEILIQTPDKNYTAHDYKELFEDIKFPQAYYMRHLAMSVVDGLKPPTGVDELYCIYGLNISTPGQMIYQPASYFHSAFPDQQPTVVPDNGDGTVNQRSLEICLNWPGVQHLVLPNAEHLSILSDKRYIDFVITVANAKAKLSIFEYFYPMFTKLISGVRFDQDDEKSG